MNYFNILIFSLIVLDNNFLQGLFLITPKDIVSFKNEAPTTVGWSLQEVKKTNKITKEKAKETLIIYSLFFFQILISNLSESTCKFHHT